MITLSLDNLTKIVATQAQADVLLKQGYSYVSGSAEATDVSLAATTGYVESGNGNPSYRGDGCLGELDGGLMHLVKTAMAGDNVTSDMLDVLRDAYNLIKEGGDMVPGDFTEMEAVTEFPDIAETTNNTLYLLTETDGEFGAGLYAPDYDTFTPLADFNVERAPEAVLAQLSAAYDNLAGIVVDDISSQSAIEAYILPLIQAEIDVIDDNFTASFVSSSWTPNSRFWSGRIELTHKTNAVYTYTDNGRNWLVAQEAETVHGEISAAYDTGADIIVDDYSSKSAVEAFILPLIQAEVNAYDNHFVVSFVSSTYDAPTCVWTGKVKVQDTGIAANFYQDSAARTWTIGVPAEGIHEQISALYDDLAQIVVDDISSKATIEGEILPLIQAEIDVIDDNFTASFVSSTWTAGTRTWAGKICLTDENIPTNTFTDASARSWTVGQDAEDIRDAISAAYNTGATIEVTDYSSKATVEAFILPLIQAGIDAIDNNFTASFVSSSYDDQAHTWTGKIKVQDEGITGNSFTDATARTWTITQAT
jgi:hypothetical protein